MSRREGGLRRSGFPRSAVDSYRHRQDGRLRIRRQLELILGSLEAELRDRKTQRLVRNAKDLARGGTGVIEGATHSDRLRALSGKDVCRCHVGDPRAQALACSLVRARSVSMRWLSPLSLNSLATRMALRIARLFERP